MFGWNSLNPRRRWIKRKFKEEIDSSVIAILPPRYSVDEEFLRFRAGNTGDQWNAEKNAENSFQGGASNDQSKVNTNSATWVAAEAAAIYGADIFNKFQSIDDHVYEAMSRLAGENISSMGDLAKSLGEYKHDFWGEISDKGLDKWKGHLAEPYAAEHFSQAGSNVEWPEASNQKGWDLLVNGHEVNVKLVSDIGSLSQHFEKYPDIAVVVPSDLDLGGMAENSFIFDPTNSIDGALSDFLSSSASHKVVVDQALSAASIKDQALDAADLAIGGTSSVDAHIPWVTVATAGWRELKLLDSGKTDFGTASKNLAADVVGRGGGAMLGGKGGAVIGTAILPGIGTAVGGVIGAIGGAIFGGMGSNSYKRRELDGAIESVINTQNELNKLQIDLQSKSESDFKNKRFQLSCSLSASCNKEKVQIAKSLQKMKHKHYKRTHFDDDQISQWVQAGRDQVEEISFPISEQIQGIGFFTRYIWPNLELVTLEEKQFALTTLSRNLTMRKAGDKSTVPANVVLDQLSSAGLIKERVGQYLQHTEKMRKETEAVYRKQINHSYANIIEKRHQAFSELSSLANKISTEIRDALKPKLRQLEMQVDRIEIEKAKLGLA